MLAATVLATVAETIPPCIHTLLLLLTACSGFTADMLAVSSRVLERLGHGRTR